MAANSAYRNTRQMGGFGGGMTVFEGLADNSPDAPTVAAERAQRNLDFVAAELFGDFNSIVHADGGAQPMFGLQVARLGDISDRTAFDRRDFHGGGKARDFFKFPRTPVNCAISALDSFEPLFQNFNDFDLLIGQEPFGRVHARVFFAKSVKGGFVGGLHRARLLQFAPQGVDFLDRALFRLPERLFARGFKAQRLKFVQQSDQLRGAAFRPKRRACRPSNRSSPFPCKSLEADI